MSDEELQRIREYVAKIEAADGDLLALTSNESLVKERLLDSEAEGSEGRWDFEKNPF